MNIQKMIQYIFAGFVLLTIFGFQQLTKNKPEDLGLHQAKISDMGLSQLKIQQDAASKGFLPASGKTAKQNPSNNNVCLPIPHRHDRK